MIEAKKNVEIKDQSKSGTVHEATDKKDIIQNANDKSKNNKNEINTNNINNNDMTNKISNNNNIINILDFLKYDKNKFNMKELININNLNNNLNIEGLSGDLENIKNYFEQILVNNSFNDYYNKNSIYEDNLCYQFNYGDINNISSNIKLTELDNSQMRNAETRVTSISTMADNTSWRGNFINFYYNNYYLAFNYGVNHQGVQYAKIDPQNYTQTVISERDIETMNAWHNVQSQIPNGQAVINNQQPANFTTLSFLKPPGRADSPVYNINTQIMTVGNYSVPTSTYAQLSTLNKQFVQSNEIYKNTRLQDAQVCNTINRQCAEIIFGRTQNVGLNYTNKTNQLKLILYLLMYYDFNNEYLRNYNSNNLMQTIAEFSNYSAVDNQNRTYYNRDDFHVYWCSRKQFLDYTVANHTFPNIQNSEIYFVPISFDFFNNNIYFFLTILSIIPYPLITKQLYSYFVYATRYQDQGDYYWVHNLKRADFMSNCININGFRKICFVIIDSDSIGDNINGQNYYIPIFNIYGQLNCQITNLFNNDIVQVPNHEFDLNDIQQILLGNYMRNNYFGIMKNYIVNMRKWELDASIFEFAINITTILKCNYQPISEYDIHSIQAANFDISNYNYDNETWPICPNGLMYTNMTSGIIKDMSIMYYSDFRTLLCEYLGIIVLKRPKVSIMLTEVDDIINAAYLIRLKSNIMFNDRIKDKKIPTIPDNAAVPTNSILHKALEQNIYLLINNSCKSEITFINPASGYQNIKENIINNFYSFHKLSTTLTTALIAPNHDEYDSYIYSNTYKWIMNYFNKNEWEISTIRENRIININKLANESFGKLINIPNNDNIMRYALYSWCDKYSSKIEKDFGFELENYISSCYSLVVNRANDNQRNAGIYKVQKLNINYLNYNIDRLLLPLITITPFTCYVDIQKHYWIFSTYGTDFQLIFSDIRFNMFDAVHKRQLAFIIKNNNIGMLLPKFFSGRINQNKQMQDIDAPQEVSIDELIDY